MGRFSSEIDRAFIGIKTRADLVQDAATAKAFTSIVFGSETTASPGQPVEEGGLRESWQHERVDAETTRIWTDSPYAESNEDGIARPGGGTYQLRSKVGGRRSVAHTVANFDRLVAESVEQLGGST